MFLKGLQYCCDSYLLVHSDNAIDISMTSKHDPYENLKAERVNGIHKIEFELDKPEPNICYATIEITKTIRIYN